MITRRMYRDALHIYLVNAYPEDDESYYSKWAGMVGNDFFREGQIKGHCFPIEVRFACSISGNTKLRCYPSGFMFDMNCFGDSEQIIKKLEVLKEKIEREWKKAGLPLHSERFDIPNRRCPNCNSDDITPLIDGLIRKGRMEDRR